MIRPRIDPRLGRLAVALSACLALSTGCGGDASTLNPAGEPAGEIAVLFWGMTMVAVVVWVGMVSLGVFVTRRRDDSDRQAFAQRLILLGAGIPTVVLAALLIVGLRLLPRTMPPTPADAVRVFVHAERWWWRIRYQPKNGPSFELANEVRLPVGRPVEFILTSDNVIHSFWIPSLGGKMDVIPGRTNRLVLRPTRVGSIRGLCAEFCGLAHAHMRFDVIVVSAEDFARWSALQSGGRL